MNLDPCISSIPHFEGVWGRGPTWPDPAVLTVLSNPAPDLLGVRHQPLLAAQPEPALQGHPLQAGAACHAARGAHRDGNLSS